MLHIPWDSSFPWLKKESASSSNSTLCGRVEMLWVFFKNKLMQFHRV